MDQAAEILGVSRSTIQRAVRAGTLKPIPSIRIKPVIFLEAAILAMKADAPVSEKDKREVLKGNMDRHGVVKLSALKKISRSARAGKGGAK